MGRDIILITFCNRVLSFQSTLPAWGETYAGAHCHPDRGDFNPLSPHGERPLAHRCPQTPAISIHSPRMGRDTITAALRPLPSPFQSTLPAWGETHDFQSCGSNSLISIHSPRMGRDPDKLYPVYQRQQFQSTLPAWGETTIANTASLAKKRFQSTLPAWGETKGMYTSNSCEWISIHSPRMGRDAELQPARLWPDDFNPLSPHGERLYAISGMGTPLSFQSTLPAWGETRPARPPGLLEHHFNPLSPHGERRAARRWMCLHPDFNPLSPHGERRMLLSRTPTRPEHFNPLSPHGERPKCCTSSCVQTQFQSTLPAWGETFAGSVLAI